MEAAPWRRAYRWHSNSLPMSQRGLLLLLVTMVIVLTSVETSAEIQTVCNRVRVHDDAVFCVQSDHICGGNVQGTCPRKGDQAVTDCFPHYSSFVHDLNDCIAPIDAQCVQLPTSSAWSCAFPTHQITITTTALRAAREPVIHAEQHALSNLALNAIVGSAVALVVAASVAFVRRPPALMPPPLTPTPPVTPRYYVSESVYMRL